MLDYIKNYPWRHYNKTLFGTPKPTSAVFYLKFTDSAPQVSLLTRQSDKLRFEAEVQKISGSPFASSQPAGGVFHPSVFPRINSHNRFIVDHPECVIKFMRLTPEIGANSVARLRATPIANLLPNFEESQQKHVWEFLAPNLAPLSDPMPKAFVLIGMPKRLVESLERWAEAVHGRVSTITPALLAALHWSLPKTSQFLLVPGATSSFLALVKDNKLNLLVPQKGFALLKPEGLQETIESLNEKMGIATSEAEPLMIFPSGDIPLSKMKDFANAFSDNQPKLIPATTKMPIVSSAAGGGSKNTPIEACIMEGLL